MSAPLTFPAYRFRVVEMLPAYSTFAVTSPLLPDVVYVRLRIRDQRWTAVLDDRVPPGAIWYATAQAAVDATKDWVRT